jgi:hypothetical protein
MHFLLRHKNREPIFIVAPQKSRAYIYCSATKIGGGDEWNGTEKEGTTNKGRGTYESG